MFGEHEVKTRAVSATSYVRAQSLGMMAVVVATVGIPGAANAQARVTLTPRANTCASLASMPSILVSTPEGRSVVRLQRELETVAQLAARRGDEISEMRNLLTVRRDVDSLMQIIVHQLRDSSGTSIFVYSHDSSSRITASERLNRALIEERIRDLQPRVAAITRLQLADAPFTVTQQAGNGWIGLRISGSFYRETSSQGLVTRYCDEYPVIEAVDPGSPAEKGGLQSGDTLIAFNGRDVLTTPIVHSETFVPGQQLRVKVRRTGRVRETPIVVAQPRVSSFRYTLAPTAACASGQACVYTFQSDSTGGFPPGIVTSGSFQAARATTVRGAPPVPVVGMLTRESGTTMVAGAQLTLVNRELAQNLGLDEGLLVTRVLGGTPMAESGLKAGDVIRVVNGVAARDVSVLHQAFAGGMREVRLSVATKGQEKPRLVVVRW